MTKRKKKVVVAKKELQFITSEIDCARKQILTAQKMLSVVEQFMEKNRVLFECIATLRPGKLYVLNNTWSGQNGVLVIVGCRVTTIKDIEPVLALMEKQLGVTFDASEDRPDLMWRSYTSKQLRWLRVDAEVVSDSQTCRQVIVGYEQTPKYEMQCD